MIRTVAAAMAGVAAGGCWVMRSSHCTRTSGWMLPAMGVLDVPTSTHRYRVIADVSAHRYTGGPIGMYRYWYSVPGGTPGMQIRHAWS
jgi:hypothetical protein